MKAYYVMIRFDGPYVAGFVVPQAEDERHALTILKNSIAARITFCNQKGIKQETHMGDDNVPRLKQYIRSLKRPWRKSGNVRKNREKKALPDTCQRPMVDILEMTNPAHAGFWLSDITVGKHLCNMRNSSSL